MELSKVIDDSVYDALYSGLDKTHDNPQSSPYFPLFSKAADRICRIGVKNLLEVGCGSGTLGQIIMEKGDLAYRGFDISPVGVEKAKKRNTRGDFFVGSAMDPSVYEGVYDGILSCEVLEHIEDDRGAICLWRSGTRVVCSVPNFDYPTHYRLFVDEEDVRKRYGDLINITKIERVAKPIFPQRTLNSYLGSLRYAAAKGNFKRVAGLMGVRKFDWHAGWFLFSGVRK